MTLRRFPNGLAFLALIVSVASPAFAFPDMGAAPDTTGPRAEMSGTDWQRLTPEADMRGSANSTPSTLQQRAIALVAGNNSSDGLRAEPVPCNENAVTITMTARQFVASAAGNGVRLNRTELAGPAGVGTVTITVEKQMMRYGSSRLVTTWEPDATAYPAFFVPRLVDGRTADLNFMRDTQVSVPPETIARIPSVGRPEEQRHLNNYLGSFAAITSRKYTDNGVSEYVCRHFARDLAVRINNDRHNPGYAAYYLGYAPVTADGAPDPKRGRDPKTGEGGIGHAINIIEAPYQGSAILSKFWLVDPQGGRVIGSFVGDRGNPTPPTWFIRSFLDSSFNRACDFTGGFYRVRVLGSDKITSQP